MTKQASKQAKIAPTPVDVFLDRTCFFLAVLVRQVLREERPYQLTPKQSQWFIDHCDRRVRYLHALNPRWREWLENCNPKIDPRDQCKVWIRHWLAAYTLDPARYQEQCGE